MRRPKTKTEPAIDPSDAFRDDEAHRWRHENIGRLLLNGYRNFEAFLARELQRKGFTEVRSVHLGVMRYMDMDGTRITTIAERSGVTKQAISQFLGEAAKLGLVAIRPDPTDGRAKIACFTPRGNDLIESAREIIAEFERQLDALLGADSLAQLRRSLVKLEREWPQDSTLAP